MQHSDGMGHDLESSRGLGRVASPPTSPHLALIIFASLQDVSHVEEDESRSVALDCTID